MARISASGPKSVQTLVEGKFVGSPFPSVACDGETVDDVDVDG